MQWPPDISASIVSDNNPTGTITNSDLEMAGLLMLGEYTVKSHRNETKQTVQFRIQDVTFFRRDSAGSLRQMSRIAAAHDLLQADSATLKLDNQKNGWKGVCIHQEANGEPHHCPVKALARRYNHIRSHTSDTTTFLSAFYTDECRFDVTDKDIRFALKEAAKRLHYPILKGIPVSRVDTHSLRSGGANALSLSGYSDTQIQKNGTMAKRNVQGIHSGGIGVFLRWNVPQHEAEIQFCKHRRWSLHRCHRHYNTTPIHYHSNSSVTMVHAKQRTPS